MAHAKKAACGFFIFFLLPDGLTGHFFCPSLSRVGEQGCEDGGGYENVLKVLKDLCRGDARWFRYG